MLDAKGAKENERETSEHEKSDAMTQEVEIQMSEQAVAADTVVNTEAETGNECNRR